MIGYDILKEDVKYQFLEYAILDKQIYFYDFKLNLPKVDKIIEIGETLYYKMLIPLMADISYYTGNTDLDGKLSLFEFILLQDKQCKQDDVKKESLLDFLNKSLKYFFDEEITDIVPVYLNLNLILIADKKMLVIDSKKFEELRNIICELTNSVKLTYENLPKQKKQFKTKDKVLQERVRIFLKNREEFKKKDTKTIQQNKMLMLYNIISFVANHRGYDVVRNYNIYQLMNAYNFINANTKFKIDASIATSGYAPEKFVLQDVREVLAK